MVNITAWLEIQGARYKIERSPLIFYGGDFTVSTTLELHFNPCGSQHGLVANTQAYRHAVMTAELT